MKKGIALWNKTLVYFLILHLLMHKFERQAVRKNRLELMYENAMLRQRIEELEDKGKVYEQAEMAGQVLAQDSLQGIFIIQDGRMAFANRRAADLTGYTQEELAHFTPDRISQTIRFETTQADRAAMHVHFRGESRPEIFEYPFTHKNGEERWFEAYTRLVTYNNRPAYLHAFLDITDQKKARQAYETLLHLFVMGILVIRLPDSGGERRAEHGE